MEAFQKVIEVWENSNLIWFVNAKNSYKKYIDLYEHEGDDSENWSEDHIAMQNYLKKSYAKDRGISQKEYVKIRNYTTEQYKEHLKAEGEEKLFDIVKRVQKIAGDIEVVNLANMSSSYGANIEVRGVWADVLVSVRFKKVNGKLRMKTHINESRRFF